MGAVTWCMKQKEVAVIHGPPGTGKSTTLVELLKQAMVRKEKVLVCAASNAAVDNLLERVKKEVGCKGLVRIGHPANMEKAHTKLTLESLARKKKKKGSVETGVNPERAILVGAKVVFGTLTGCFREVSSLPANHFSLTIVDECGQAMEAAVWMVVRYTTKLVLAGDHFQLPPTVLSNNSKVKTALGVSMMERLVKEFKDSSMVRMLDTQYRMAETIMRWSSNTFYDGRLKAGPGIGAQTLAMLPGVRSSLLITKKQLLLIDTKGKMRQNGSYDPLSASIQNPGEAKVVVKTVKQLIQSGVRPEQIGVISFYALQVQVIREQLNAISFDSVKVNSVDGFQGQEKEVIILSTVRSNKEKNIGFLKENRRLNVAVTRAKRLLVVVADRETLQKNNTYKGFFEHVEMCGEIKLM